MKEVYDKALEAHYLRRLHPGFELVVIQHIVPIRLVVLAQKVFVHSTTGIDTASSFALDLTLLTHSILAAHFNVKRPTGAVAAQQTRIPAPPLETGSDAHSGCLLHLNAMHIGHKIENLVRIRAAVRQSVVEITQDEAVVVQVWEFKAKVVRIQMQSLQHIDSVAIAAQHLGATLSRTMDQPFTFQAVRSRALTPAYLRIRR